MESVQGAECVGFQQKHRSADNRRGQVDDDSIRHIR